MSAFVSWRVLRTLNLLALATLLAVGAFHWGRAGASRGGTERRRTAIVEAVRHAAPAVVSVFADSVSRRGAWRRGAGAGVLVHPSGYVVTNSHVIRGGSRVKVELFHDGGSYQAQVVTDRPSEDLALLRIQRAGGFPYVSVAPTREVMLGESAIAIGNPHGLGDTITVGVVSALGRDAKLSTGAALRNLIQTDASINTGNSGGALLNLDGELLGIIVSLLPQSTGIAFAIPGDQVRAMLQGALGSAPAAKPLPAAAPTPEPPPGLEPGGGRASSRVERAQVFDGDDDGLPPPAVGQRGATSGIKTTPMRPEDFGMILKDDGAWLEVQRVVPSSAASLAGIRVGDVVLAIDGRPVENDLDIVLALSAARPGRVYQVAVRRGAAVRHAALITPE